MLTVESDILPLSNAVLVQQGSVARLREQENLVIYDIGWCLVRIRRDCFWETLMYAPA